MILSGLINFKFHAELDYDNLIFKKGLVDLMIFVQTVIKTSYIMFFEVIIKSLLKKGWMGLKS